MDFEGDIAAVLEGAVVYECGCSPERDIYCFGVHELVEKQRASFYRATTSPGLRAEERWIFRQNAKEIRREVVRHLQEQENNGHYRYPESGR